MPKPIMSPRPSWIDQTMPGHFVGLSRPAESEAEARQQALADGRRQIVESLGIQLGSELLDRVVEERTGGLSQLDERTEVKVQTASKAVVQAAPQAWHVEQTRDGMFLAWCRISFSEAKHRAFVQEMVQATLAVAGDIHGKGSHHQTRGDVARALDAYADALEALEDLKGWTSDRDLLTRPDQLRAEIRGKAKDLLGRLSVTTARDGQTGRVGEALPSPLSVKVVSDRLGRLQPVPHLGVRFEWALGSGDMDQIANTDQLGVAVCRVRRIDDPGRHEVRATIGDSRWERLMDTVLPQAGFHFSAFYPTCLVHIGESVLSRRGEQSTVQTQITQALRDAGFEVLTPKGRPPAGEDAAVRWAREHDADLLVFGAAAADDVRRVMDGYYVVTASAQIHVRDTATGKVVTTLKLVNSRDTDTRGFGSTEDAAARDAIQFRKVADLWPGFVRNIQRALVEE